MTLEQFAVVATSISEPLAVKALPVPDVGPNDILVENVAIGLNPIDWKSKRYNFGIYSFPWINGRESCGKVVSLGENVKLFQLGEDVIIASTSYRDLRTSTFQNFTAIDHRLVWKKPDYWSFEEGATLGVGLTTAASIIYDSFGIELDARYEKQSIIIWGASTVVGLYVIQLAKIHNLKVIGIAGKEYTDILKERGTDIVIDKSETLEAIKDKLKLESVVFGVDCISEATSKSLLSILEDHNGTFAGIVKVPKTTNNVKVAPVTIKRFHEDVDFGANIITVTSKYLENGQITPVRQRIYKGLESIELALTDLELKGAKAEKYVVTI